MKLIKTIARIALLAVTVSVLTPGIASASDTFPDGPLIHLPSWCINPVGLIELCPEDPEPAPVIPIPGDFNWDGIVVDLPIFDPSIIFPVDPGPGVEEPGDDAPVEEPSSEPVDDAPVAEEPHDEAPVAEEPPAEEPHEDAPAAAPVADESDTVTKSPTAETPTGETIEATATPESTPTADVPSDDATSETSIAAAPVLETETQGLPTWLAALGGMLAALALFGAHALGKRDA
ncbi:MAG TPA: hypothetical protein ENG98_02650 [Actinobacteria bacterium]|nr:hypothetical protein [Actinomycetota bacterium]